MARYNAKLPFAVAYPPQLMTDVLAEWISKKGIRQAHIAETKQYAHVTFNDGVEKRFDSDDQHLIASPT